MTNALPSAKRLKMTCLVQVLCLMMISLFGSLAKVFSGILRHSDSGAIEISERRVAKIVTVCSIIDCEFVISARCLASFTGQIISTGPVVGSVSRIMTRNCPMPSTCAPYWDAFLELDQYGKGRNYFLEGEY